MQPFFQPDYVDEIRKTANIFFFKWKTTLIVLKQKGTKIFLKMNDDLYKIEDDLIFLEIEDDPNFQDPQTKG